MNYYEHHIGDWDQATAHLTAIEDGIYSRLVRWYMANEGPLPLDVAAIQRRVRARARDEKAAVEAVLDEFFERKDDGYHQHRCDEEVARFQDKQRKAKASADARWSKDKAHSERNANASQADDANGMRPHCEGNALQSPVPNHQSKTPLPPVGGMARFEDFWSAWPKNERKQDKVKCAKKWKSDGLDAEADRILADIAVKKQTQKWQQGFVEAPLVYLNGKRWEDGVRPGAAETAGIDDWTRDAR